jgi:uncharacterized membrane protein YdfJ with MMPL/SSD domain
MNPYELIAKVKERMKDPNFATRFNNASNVVSSIPGLQQEIMRIAQINDQKAQDAAIERLPREAKQAVQEILNLLNM